MTPVSGITLVAIGEDSVCPDTTVEPLTSIIGFCSDLIPSVLDRQKGGKSLGHRESVSYKTRSADGQVSFMHVLMSFYDCLKHVIIIKREPEKLRKMV